MDDRVSFAPEKLLNVAREDTDQGRRVANFLPAWWNAEVHGGFDLSDLANFDPRLGSDLATIFTFLARKEDVVYPDDYRGGIEAIIANRRPQAERA